MKAIAVVLGFLVTVQLLSSTPQNCDVTNHVSWVRSSMIEMATVKVGMRRADVERVFATEGGLSTRAQRTYVYRNCPYFKVDVEFSWNEGQQSGEELDDRVAKISAPYLAWTHTD